MGLKGKNEVGYVAVSIHIIYFPFCSSLPLHFSLLPVFSDRFVVVILRVLFLSAVGVVKGRRGDGAVELIYCHYCGCYSD